MYNFKSTATECSSGGTAIYIKKYLNCKLRKDFKIYKSKQLEYTFIEANLNNEKVLIDCLYRHQSMELWEFNSNDLTNFLDNLSAENITVVLLGDFDENPFIYDQNKNISDFLDLMYFSISICSHIFS